MQYAPRSTIAGVVTAAMLSTASALPAAAAGGESGDYSKMQEEVVSADDLLSAGVANGLHPIGSVTELVTNADVTALQYILYDVPYPYGFYAEGERGFTTFGTVRFEPTSGHGLTVRLVDADAGQAPEQLQLEASEADHRLVSELLGEHMQFSDGEARQVTDILFERSTGEIAFFVVDMDAESLFDLDRRTIPADIVSVNDSGAISADTNIKGVDEITQKYSEELL